MSTRQPLPAFFPFPNTAFDVVVIATSLGGITALSQLLSTLPVDFPAAIIIVQHLSPGYPSMLADLLNRRTALPVKWAEQGEYAQPSNVYLAPPDYHLRMTKSGTFSLSQSAPVQFVRPSANLLFESVAENYGERSIAVVLTGLGSDGARGVQAMKRFGGRVLVQDRVTSKAFSMPEAAIRTGCVDFVLPLKTIASALVTLLMVRGAATFFHVQKAPRLSLVQQSRFHWGAVESNNRPNDSKAAT